MLWFKKTDILSGPHSYNHSERKNKCLTEQIKFRKSTYEAKYYMYYVKHFLKGGYYALFQVYIF